VTTAPRCATAAALGLAASIASFGCVEIDPLSPAERQAEIIRSSVCDAVLASARNGLRPTVVDVSLPSPRRRDPSVRVVFAGEAVPSVEVCAGYPTPLRAAPRAVTPSGPAPSPPPQPPASNVPSVSPSAPVPSPPSNPLDTRT
jgi:hypothetical protein